jgi:hypothetical protein
MDMTTEKINTAISLKNNENEVFIDCYSSSETYTEITDETINTLISNNLALEIWTPSYNEILNANKYVTGMTTDQFVAGYVLYNTNIN